MLVTLNTCTTKDTDHLWLAREMPNGPPFGLLLGPLLVPFSRLTSRQKKAWSKQNLNGPPFGSPFGSPFGLLSLRDDVMSKNKYWGSWGMSPFLAGSRSPMTRGAQTQIIKTKHKQCQHQWSALQHCIDRYKADRHANDTNTRHPPPPARVQRQGDQFQAIHQAVLTNLLARHMNHPPHPSSDTVTTYNINKAPFLNQGE